jgi:hypothetical protein
MKTTIVSSSIIYKSGSSKFGDSPDDRHEMTGSLFVVGSINGNLTGSVTGSFTGSVRASNGLSGSLQRLTTGESYLVGGANISVVTQSNGQVEISTAGTPTPTAVGQILFAVDGTSFVPALPITSEGAGWLINDNGILLVSSSS